MGVIMQQDFFEEFYSNLSEEIDNKYFLEDIEKLIRKGSLNKKNYMTLIEREFHAKKSKNK